MSQEIALQKAKEGKNIFITGSGGVGKSYTSRQIIDDRTLAVAPTGVAALQVGGMTAHRAFNLPIGVCLPQDKYKLGKKFKELFSNDLINHILIDEGAMLRADYLDLINDRLQIIKDNDKPFGGIKTTMVGDFFQLEPIVSWKDNELFYREYKHPFCFGSRSWDFETIELTKVYRQEDERQVRILNSIRKKDRYHKLAIDRINDESRNPDTDDENTLQLCCYKKDAKKVNDIMLDRLIGKSKFYKASTSGKDLEWKDSPVELNLELKIGAKVVICANDVLDQYVNGDRGTIINMGSDWVMVELIDGRQVFVNPNKWEKYDYKTVDGQLNKEVESTLVQMPIKLGWAISIHSSQGMNLDNVCLDVGKGCFAHGMGYVALSRITDLRNLSLLTPLHYDDIIVKKEVRKFYEEIEYRNN